MFRAVVDTNVLIAARRSRSGASNALLRLAVLGKFRMLISVPLFLEYEAVLTRPEHLEATGLAIKTAVGFLDYLAEHMAPVRLHFLWKPQLTDVADEMVLETAINGKADMIVTFNRRHFGAARRFGIEVVTPREALEKIG